MEDFEDSEVVEAQLDREEVELEGVRFSGGLDLWVRSKGLVGKTGLCLLIWRPPRPRKEKNRKTQNQNEEDKLVELLNPHTGAEKVIPN